MLMLLKLSKIALLLQQRREAILSAQPAKTSSNSSYKNKNLLNTTAASS